MTVLEHDPVAFHGSILNHVLCFLSHTLTQRQELEFVHSKSDSLDELLHITEGISTGTQDEDDGSEGSRAVVNLLEVERR